MKPINIKNTFLCLLGIVATLLSSCGEAIDDMLAGSNDGQQVTFSLSAEGPEQSRATAAGLRYVMAIYDESGENVIVPETVFDQSTFSVRLDPGKYTCLFWADYGSENYDATNLNDVKLSDDATNAEAFYAKQGITVTSGATVNVTLSRAVAQVILRETATLPKGTMTVGYSGYQNFDVSTGIASNEASVTKTIAIASDVFGSSTSPAEVCSIFLLANSEEQILSEIKVKYKDGEEKIISNVPIQANCKTNLNGSFGDTPYLTFSAADEQMFGMNFNFFSFGEGEYFEYAVGNGEWTKFTASVSNIAFGGTRGDLRLRGKSSQGTATNDMYYCRISFSDPATPVGCTGDIRTLIDYTDYAHVSTANARFCNLFWYCTSLTQAPALPATTLATGCYSFMFYYCTSLSSVTMLATNVSASDCFDYWLYNAGTEASTRTLTLANQDVYNTLSANAYSLPDNWKQGAEGTTVNFNNISNDENNQN